MEKANTKLSYKLAGFDHHMTKPAAPWELETLLLKLPTAAKSVVCRLLNLGAQSAHKMLMRPARVDLDRVRPLYKPRLHRLKCRSRRFYAFIALPRTEGGLV